MLHVSLAHSFSCKMGTQLCAESAGKMCQDLKFLCEGDIGSRIGGEELRKADLSTLSQCGVH